MRVLAEASAAGAWWVPEILTEDDDLAALRGRPEFERVVAVSPERVSDDAVPALVESPDGPLAGTVVALHGAGQTAAHARDRHRWPAYSRWHRRCGNSRTPRRIRCRRQPFGSGPRTTCSRSWTRRPPR
ncbi:MAG: hypothetical protein HOV67_01970 [Kribbellaceae bacterium]|nr:hypothetical protein [Kribbellaceae bacterium]